LTVRVGDRLIGVRVNDREVGDALRHVLGPAVAPVVTMPGAAPPNLSLLVGSESGNVHGLHFLYSRGSQAVRTASRTRLLRATLAHLDGFRDPPPGATRLATRVFLHDGAAVLVDEVIGPMIDLVERRLTRLGYVPLDLPHALVDRDTLAIIVPAPGLGADPAALEALERRWEDAAGPVLRPGRYPLRALLVADAEQHPSAARRLARIASLAAGRSTTLAAVDLVTLRDLELTRTVVRLPNLEGSEIVAVLKDLAS
jgi:hypothetical protein